MKSLVMILGLMLSFAYARAQVDTMASRILNAPHRWHGIRDSREGITLKLIGIYTENAVLYYRLEVTNHSRVPFYPDSPRFYIRDKKRMRRHAFQEMDQKPTETIGGMEPIEAGQTRVWVVALVKMIPDVNQCLVVDLRERGDTRSLKLTIGCRRILKADFVNDL